MNSIKNKIGKLVSKITGKTQKPETIFLPMAKMKVEKKPEPVLQDVPLASHFKNLTVQRRAAYMHNELLRIMLEMVIWVELEFKFTPVITETVTLASEDAALGRKSVSHQQGRAFDMRTRGWTKEQIDKFVFHFTAKYGHLGAFSIRSGKPCLIVHHDAGTGPHFHVQLNGNYSVANLQNILKEIA